MNRNPQHMIISVVCGAGIVLSILSIYFGSYLSLEKAQRYIKVLQDMGSVKSVDMFKANVDRVTTFYSPIGDEEVAKFLSNDVFAFIGRLDQKSEDVDRALVSYIEPYLMKNNVRHLLTLGEMYRVLLQKYGRENDFIISEKYYLKALALGPDLPPVLYSLLRLYDIHSDKEKTLLVAQKILFLWPDDVVTQQFVQAISSP